MPGELSPQAQELIRRRNENIARHQAGNMPHQAGDGPRTTHSIHDVARNTDQSIKDLNRLGSVDSIEQEMSTFDSLPEKVRNWLNDGFAVKPSAVDVSRGLSMMGGNVDRLMHYLHMQSSQMTPMLTRAAYGDDHPSLKESNIITGDLLLENRIEWLKKNIKPFTIDHDTSAQHTKPEDIIDHFAEHADPSPKKIYTQWIMNQYAKQKVRQEDAAGIMQTLRDFEARKNVLEHKDINKYDIHSLAEEILKKDPEKSRRQEKQEIKHEGAETVHSDDHIHVVKLKNEAAAKFYGSGTRWCTTSGMFNHYHQQGPLYVVIDRHTGDKYQMHFESNQYADATDRNIGIAPLLNKFPTLVNVQEFKDHPHTNALPFKTPEEAERSYAYIAEGRGKNNEENLRYAKLTPSVKHLKMMASHASPDIRVAVASNSRAKQDPTIYDDLLNDPNTSVRVAVAAHSPRPEHSRSMINDPAPQVRRTIAEFSPVVDNLDTLIHDRDQWTVRAALKNPYIQKHHLDTVIQNAATPWHIAEAMKASRFKEHWDIGGQHKNPRVREEVAKVSKDRDQLRVLIKDSDRTVAETANKRLKALENGIVRD